MFVSSFAMVSWIPEIISFTRFSIFGFSPLATPLLRGSLVELHGVHTTVFQLLLRQGHGHVGWFRRAAAQGDRIAASKLHLMGFKLKMVKQYAGPSTNEGARFAFEWPLPTHDPQAVKGADNIYKWH